MFCSAGKQEFSGCSMYDYDYEMIASKGVEWAKNNLNLLSNGTKGTIQCSKRSFDSSIHSITTQVRYSKIKF